MGHRGQILGPLLAQYHLSSKTTQPLFCSLGEVLEGKLGPTGLKVGDWV